MRRKWLASLLVALAVFGLLWGGNAGALWEPHELGVAELSRRIALNLLGGAGLALPGAENSVPIRADLGRGELPFTSAAVGLRIFGLHDWAGRLPLAVWALLGLGSLFAGLSRLWDRRAALYAVLILASTPLYFLQARTLLGDAVTLACFAMAWSGLSVALLAPAQSGRARAGFALLGVVGLYAGFWCRGSIVSVAVPALSVALAALLVGGAPGRASRALAGVTLLVGLVALGIGATELAGQPGEEHYSPWVGSALAASPTLPTFEAPLTALAHACFPWSAAAPLALALPWASARTEPAVSGPAAAAALSLAGSLATAAWLAPAVGNLPLLGAIGLAVLVAGALRELERARAHLAPLALSVAALALVIGFDLRVYPDKALVGFGLAGATLPEALQAASRTLWTTSALGLAAAVVWSLFEHGEVAAGGSRPARFQREEYVRVLGSLQRVWDGNLVFALVVLEAALVGFLLLSAISERLVSLPQLEAFGSFWRTAVAAGAIAVPLLPLAPVAVLLLRDLGRAFYEGEWLGARLTPTRPQGVLAAGLAIGAIASLWFYPALSRQVAPKAVFERFAELRKPGELLGKLGQREGEGSYHGGLGSVTLASVPEAFSWLHQAGQTGPRRWLLLGRSDLGELNAAFREQHLGNVPILDARSSEVFLATNRLRRGERDDNPLSGLVLDRAPPPQHPLRAVLGDRKLEVLGWSLTDQEGQLQTHLTPAKRYRFIIYLRVLDRLSGDWQAFVHLDGLQQRFNADHDLLEGKYPLALWREGDVLADATELMLEPTFAPGRYSVYFGLFSGERRLAVSEGPEADDRIAAGTVEIN